VETCGHDVDTVDNFGWTPLHFSVLLGNVDGFDYLIEKGADPTKVTSNDIDLEIINERSKHTKEPAKAIFREKFATLLPKKPEEKLKVSVPETEEIEEIETEKDEL
jgi:ankyrin repeat protein